MIDAAGIVRGAARVAETLGITLVQDEDCEQPHTDLATRVITVPLLSAYTEPEKLDRWLGYVYHEIGHNDPRLADMLEYRKANPFGNDTLYARISGVLEDIRNERNRNGDYPGRDISLAKTQSFHAKEGAETLKRLHDEGQDLGKDKSLFAQTLGMAYRYRGDTFQPLVSAGSMSFDSVTDSSWMDKYMDDIANMSTAQDVFDLTDKILDDSPDHDKEEEKQAAKEAGEAERAKGEGEEEAEANGGNSEPGEGEEEGNETDGDSIVSYKDLLAHDHTGGYGTSKGRLTIKYDHDPNYDYKPHEINDIQYPKPHPHGPKKSMQHYFNNGSKLSSQVRRLFQARSQTLKTYRHKSGNLTKRDLYRVLNLDDDVFNRKKHQLNLKGTALFILNDASGSMEDEPYDTSAAAAALMSDALSPVGITHMIGTFTEDEDKLISRVIKGWNERITPDNIMAKYRTGESYLYMNADGESILWALSELQTRPEERKILIVLSDGQPAACQPGDAWTHTKEAVALASKHVECYGIGILSSAVRDFYPEYTVLDDTSKLQACLLDVIKTKVIGA